MQNNNDYFWNVRLYNALIGSENKPNTLVCSGFLTGSTKYVIWTGNNDKLEYDLWVEFKTTGSSNIFPILEPNTDNLTLPKEGEEFRERKQIDWVEKELGFKKDITKIETKENFTYNYIANTPFTIYRVSDQHTYTSVYVEPNDNLELSRYITIYENKEDADKAQQAGDTPDKVTITPRETGRKVIGYGQETGEVRVQESFSKIPVNGNYYLLYDYDAVDKTYTLVESEVEQVVGGVAITDESFKIITNQWDDEVKQLFIQPNINIKSDKTNPNEIIFDSGERVDIIQTFSEEIIEGENIEVTFEKLDNTQWLLKYLSTTASQVPIIPGSNYKVYTDFMDASPYNIFYARKTPEIIMQFQNPNSADPVYSNIQSDTSVPYRDIAFKTLWNSENDVQIKYYQYFLYDDEGELITQSKEYFDNSLEWLFRGFQTSNYISSPMKYSITIKIVDEYNKEFFKTAEFKIYYPTDESIVPIKVSLDCEKMAIKVIATSPVYVESTDKENLKTVDSSDLNKKEDYLNIPNNKILNYTNVINEEKTPIEIPESFSFITQFQLTGDFMKTINNDEEKTICQIGCKNNQNLIDVYTIKTGGLKNFYTNTDNVIVKNPNYLKIRIYKNDSTIPLSCFNLGTKDYFDILLEDRYNEFIQSNTIYYALQDQNNYEIIETIPLRPEPEKIYVLTKNSYDLNNNFYLKGIYKTLNNKLVPDYEAEFMFLEKITDVENGSFDNLKVPLNCQGNDGIINWTEEGNYYIDNNNYTEEINKEQFDKKWFLLYLIVDNAEQENINCQISINNERV